MKLRKQFNLKQNNKNKILKNEFNKRSVRLVY